MTARNNKAAQVLIPFYGRRHHHEACQHDAVVRAEAICQNQGVRLTPIRRKVLKIIWASHKPIKAYDILESIRENDRRPAPPTVYRALDFLLDARLIHKLDSRNAFLGCGAPDQAHNAQFLICRACDNVAEIHDPMVDLAISEHADDLGFKAEREHVEIEGLCDACRDKKV